MDELKGFGINTKVEIDVDDPDHGGKFLSRVMDMNSREIRLMAPTDHGHLVLLRNKTPLSVIYVGDHALYSFNTVVIGRTKDSIPSIIIKYPSKVVRIQRREFVRLEVKIFFRYRVAQDALKEDNTNQPFKEGYVVDISGGGVRFFQPEPIKIDTDIEMILDLAGVDNEILPGKVVRNQLSEDGVYEIGVSFVGLPPMVQDKIVSWIFDKQRDLRRKGLA